MKDNTNRSNPLICNPEAGMCEIPNTRDENASTMEIKPKEIPIKIIYFTDPICSSCWGIEPQLRKLKLEYGSSIEIDYRMGGLLPDWSYNSGGISKPSDVAHHWDHASAYYDMPIDGDIWLEDPLDSSYPPSIAFKAAQIQDYESSILFLREIREMVFLQKKNITKWEYLAIAAKKVGLNVEQLSKDIDGKANVLFHEDLRLGKVLGIRGFPTMIFLDNSGHKETVYGSKPYAFYETALLQLHPDAKKNKYEKDWTKLFSKFGSLTAKEFTELSGISRTETEELLNNLTASGALEKSATKNGSIWNLKIAY